MNDCRALWCEPETDTISMHFGAARPVVQVIWSLVHGSTDWIRPGKSRSTDRHGSDAPTSGIDLSSRLCMNSIVLDLGHHAADHC